MTRRRSFLLLLLGSCFVAPIIFGVSCPPPGNPLVIAVVPDNNSVTQGAVPACIEGFVCVNLANGTTIPVKMALYVHNGFDPTNQFADPPSFQCCTNPNSQVACPCTCPNAADGDCLLTRPELFQPINLYSVNGATQNTLIPNGSLLVRIRCGDAKSIGASAALSTGDAVTAPDDSNGPVYRDEAGGVQCGQTVQFQVTNLNETGAGTGGNDLITLIIRTQFSR